MNIHEDQEPLSHPLNHLSLCRRYSDGYTFMISVLSFFVYLLSVHSLFLQGPVQEEVLWTHFTKTNSCLAIDRLPEYGFSTFLSSKTQ